MTNVRLNENEIDLLKQLQEPFSCDEICFKVTSMTQDKKKGLVAAYVTNSAIQNRLDSVFGPFGWQVSFRDWKNNNAQICCISVFDGDKWISREDGAPNTDFESIKGGLSDSMKRCARMFGIGRYLASENLFKNAWVELDNKRISKAQENRLRAEYNQFLNERKAASKPISHDTHTISETNLHANNSDVLSNNSMKTQTIQKKSQQAEPISKIPKSLCDAVLNVINLYNVNLDGILKHYNVASIEMLSVEQANDTIHQILTRNANKN
ncbi:MAG: hypothetical protein IJH34_14310 [Romboutsia sp.]|nr:hypothetical protein [Romboutsia sp.]